MSNMDSFVMYVITQSDVGNFRTDNSKLITNLL